MDAISKNIIRILNQNDLIAIEDVILYGSRTNLSLVDCWSDVDLKIVLHDDQKIDQAFIMKLLKGLGKLIAKQTLIGENEIIYRVVVETPIDTSIEMIDFKLLKKGNQRIVEQGIEIKDENDQKFWFTMFLSASKFMRRDNLIGTHLLLDNLKLLLEMEMMKRDEIKKTNIHRFGNKENIEKLLGLSQLKSENKSQIVNYLNMIGEKYDQMMLERVKNYEPKREYLLKYLKKE